MSITAHRPILTRRPPPIRERRRCVGANKDGTRCLTVLSGYHPGRLCFVHAPPERVSDAEQREALADYFDE